MHLRPGISQILWKIIDPTPHGKTSTENLSQTQAGHLQAHAS